MGKKISNRRRTSGTDQQPTEKQVADAADIIRRNDIDNQIMAMQLEIKASLLVWGDFVNREIITMSDASARYDNLFKKLAMLHSMNR